MRRRDFIKLFVASLSAYPSVTIAQRSSPVIGALSPGVEPAQFNSSIYAAFSLGMKQLGHAEGKDYLIEWRFAGGDYGRLPLLANELVASNVSIIFATNDPAILAAHKATMSIPIVMGFFDDDPTAYGLAATFARPAGNVTGLASLEAESVPKHLDFVRAILPNLNCLGVLTNPNTGYSRTALLKVQAAAEKAGIKISNREAGSPQDIEAALGERDGTNYLDAVLLIGDPMMFANRQRIAELSLSRRIPLIVAGVREFAVAGALMSYGANVSDLFRRSAAYAVKILKGAKPGDLPIEQPTQFDLAINLGTAKALGLTVPAPLLVSATEVIE